MRYSSHDTRSAYILSVTVEYRTEGLANIHAEEHAV